MNRTIFVLLAALMAMLGAAGEVFAVGTAAGDSLTNGYFTSGDTVPQNVGRLSIAYYPIGLGSDTAYKGSASDTRQLVDTGYDLAAINAPADSNGARARDTIGYGYVIQNKSNATLTMDVAGIFSSTGSDTNWGSSAYKVFNDANNDGVWADGDAVITTVSLAADAYDTVTVVVLVPTTAVEDDSSGTRFFVSDRATIVSGSVTGDLWENGNPLVASNDANDTQYDTVTTRVIGPNVKVTKQQALLSGRARPGDTIVYNITFDNEGSDSANNLVIYDAIPKNSTFVPNSADSAILASNTFVAAYDDTYSASNFNDTGNTSAKVIRWTLGSQVGATSGDSKSTINLTGVNDSGRVEFRVKIN